MATVNTKEKAAPGPLTAISGEQSPDNSNIISYPGQKSNSISIFCNKTPQNDNDLSYMQTISMDELYENVYMQAPPLIEGLLYAGTYLFVGAPKVGKSFFMLQLAFSVSTGKPLWNYSVNKGTVLYLALEDNLGRLQKRLYGMFGTDSTPDLHIATESRQFGKGLCEQLKRFVAEHKNTKLIIIDTFQKIRPGENGNYNYASDYETAAELKGFADSIGICLLLVHHTRKQQSDDKFDMISGTNGLFGAADGAFVLYKEKRGANKAVLEISGRDQPDQRIMLTRNKETLAWDFEKSETEFWTEPPEPILEKIAGFVNADSPEWTGTATELIDLIGTDIPSNAVTKKLNACASRLRDEYRISYKSSRSHDGRKLEFCFEGET